ncbi:hypothetical protein T4E_10174 [Trichinella pseudospiralis]|uniref:Uncharacterized protein n=1 Tax=Trichinella pseudospiralis TaxID=6337 RepID=A0A0V0YHC7_TRIPS|nr:hypothetical protein T4E_10174 [Trichinella pseudospiralis]
MHYALQFRTTVHNRCLKILKQGPHHSLLKTAETSAAIARRVRERVMLMIVLPTESQYKLHVYCIRCSIGLDKYSTHVVFYRNTEGEEIRPLGRIAY